MDRADMTHPLTPREKVAQIVDPWAFEFEPWNDNWKSVVARRQTEALEKADAILTALASGSGDHAELARLADDLRKFEHHAVGSLKIGMDEVRRIIAACDARAALLAENAALRAEGKARAKAHAKEIAGLYGRANTAEGELDAVSSAIGTVRFMDPPDGGDVPLSEQVRRMASALTEAERKLVEAVGLLRKFHDAWRSGCGWLPSMNALDDEITAFLSKEAERG